jgi:hypothetical protein
MGLISQLHDHFTDGRTPWTGDHLVARPLPTHRTTQTQNKRIHTPNIHALCGIRTHDPGFRASEDSSCLRPLGYRDRLIKITGYKLNTLRRCITIQRSSEHRRRVSSAPSSYSEGPRVQILAGNQLFWLKFFVCDFLSLSGNVPREYVKLSHDSILPYSFHFILTSASYLTPYFLGFSRCR